MVEQVKKRRSSGLRYTDADYHRVLARIASGMSTRAACEFRDSPNAASVRDWHQKNAENHARYVRARRSMLENEADRLLEIADTEPLDAVELGWLKHRTDTRKWLLAKLHPEYLDRQELMHGGNLQIQVVTGVPPQDDPDKELLE